MRKPLAIAIAIVVGLLFAWVLRGHSPAFPEHPPVRDGGSLLRLDENGAPLTFRGCRTSGDCSSYQGCLREPGSTEGRCQASECQTDEHCPAGYACRVMGYDRTEVIPIRRCMLAGIRREGEPCDLFARTHASACQAGLVCLHSFCGRRCRPAEPSGCPRGFTCQDDALEPACVPSCGSARCPEGESCVEMGEAPPLCGVLLTPNCHRTPCPGGQDCLAWTGRSGGRTTVRLACATRCDPSRADGCPAGAFCHPEGLVGYCHRACQQDSDCGGDRCLPLGGVGGRRGCSLASLPG